MQRKASFVSAKEQRGQEKVPYFCWQVVEGGERGRRRRLCNEITIFGLELLRESRIYQFDHR